MRDRELAVRSELLNPNVVVRGGNDLPREGRLRRKRAPARAAPVVQLTPGRKDVAWTDSRQATYRTAGRRGGPNVGMGEAAAQAALEVEPSVARPSVAVGRSTRASGAARESTEPSVAV